MFELSHEIRLRAGKHGIDPGIVDWVQSERLYAAMLSVVAEGGYREANVEKVCVRAHVSRRSFYRLFDDREACFVAAYEEVATHVFVQMMRAFEESGSLRERMQRALEELFAFCAAEPDAARACIVEVVAAPPLVRARRAEVIDRFTGVVERALRESVGDQRVGTNAAGILVGGIHALVRERVASDTVQPARALAREIAAAQLIPLRRVAARAAA
jgi:AcrR family transcriptional regulator